MRHCVASRRRSNPGMRRLNEAQCAESGRHRRLGELYQHRTGKLPTVRVVGKRAPEVARRRLQQTVNVPVSLEVEPHGVLEANRKMRSRFLRSRTLCAIVDLETLRIPAVAAGHDKDAQRRNRDQMVAASFI